MPSKQSTHITEYMKDQIRPISKTYGISIQDAIDGIALAYVNCSDIESMRHFLIGWSRNIRERKEQENKEGGHTFE